MPRPTKNHYLPRISKDLPLEPSARAPSQSRRAPPWKLRYVLALILLVVLGFSGGKWLASSSHLNMPWSESEPALNAWIDLPSYTDMKPIILASPDETVLERGTIDVPEGSRFNIEIPESDTALVVEHGGKTTPLTPDDKGQLTSSLNIERGGTITLKHGWRPVDSWRVRVLKDKPPRIAFVDPPTIYDRKSTRLAFEASDDFGVQKVLVRVAPASAGKGPKGLVNELVLMSPMTKHVKEEDIEDLTFLPWAGMPVDMQLIVIDGKGQKTETGKMTTTLPKREFTHPLAKALVEEREKLMRQPDDMMRDEAANVMAGIARETDNYDRDPLVFMALRTGAVRLVLDRGDEALPAVCRLMYQAAARIEDNQGKTNEFLRQAKREGVE